MYAGYQAHRPKMDDGLSSQFAMVKEVIEVMDIPVYEKAGYEADDVIGTLAYQATRRHPEDVRVIIVTGDRDILQLVDENVFVYMPVIGLTNGKMYSSTEVQEKFGIHPSQMVDYKALAGDVSDNYPGVRGIGPKTASNLLKKFGTIENLYDAIYHQDEKARELKDKTIQALSEYAEDAGMAKKLARIIQDAPVTLDIEKAKLKQFDTPEVLDELEKLGFASLAKRVMGIETSERVKVKKEKQQAKSKESKEDSEQLSLV
jgi:DNA polymerase-1